MTPFEKAFSEVANYVAEFSANEDHYLSPKYQEAEVRVDFLNKFWTALGWDVRHVIQTNPREQEVKVERNPDALASGRKADYAFFFKPDYKNPQFFVEAKKPSRKLGDAEAYFQTVRYGYNAGTPVCVLTDFEEFHILDCRYEPNINKSFPAAQIRAFHYKDYLDAEKFGYIYWLFSREAIEAGKLKELAKELPKQRGKGKVKLTSEEARPVDEGFLAKLEEYRLTLAKAFKKSDESLSADDLTEATQKVIDRLVFIRFLEDKNIESDYIVDEIAGKKGGAWKSFIGWSKELDVKYNGVVFKPHDIDKPTFKAPDDKVFAELCLDISHKESIYLFSLIPIEILGSIYERFLGKVVTATAKRADIEYKPEVRKAGGVYYTPKYIVDYIVGNTVGKILRTPLPVPRERGRGEGESGSDDALSPALTPTLSRSTGRGGLNPKEISKLRFADIACGSGSFLIAVYDTVLHYVELWYNNNPEDARKAGCIEIDKGIFALSLKQKQQILLDNIYGVDIDHQAVEVAQLSLFLKLLESESGATAGQLTFEKTKILPDLSKNIVCGNSLVEYDIADLFPLTHDDEIQIKPFDFKTSFKSVMDKGGFDAIVGNPPYVNAINLQELYPRERAYITSKYETPTQKWDLYIPFIERSLKLLKQNGRFSMIIPYPFVNQTYASLLRTFIYKNYRIDEIVDLFGVKVFSQAMVTNCIPIITKDKPTNQITISHLLNTEIANSYKLSLGDLVQDEKSFVWRLKKEKKVVIKVPTSILGDYCFISIGMVLNADEKKAKGLFTKDELISDVQSNIYNKPYIEAKNISRFTVNSIRFLEWGTKRVPSLIRRPTFPELYNPPKILVSKLGKIQAAYDKSHLYCDQTIRIIILWKNLKGIENASISNSIKRYYNLPRHQLEMNSEGIDDLFLLGILNTPMAQYLLGQIRGVGNMDINPEYLKNIPIPTLDLTNPSDKQKHDAVVKLVEQMLDVKKRLSSASRETERDQLTRKCEYLDGEIDRLVYGLYGLTEEEIKVVEGDV